MPHARLALATLALLPAAVASASPIPPEDAIAIALGPTRVSDMGSDLVGRAVRPSVAYGAANHEYLIVWEGYEKLEYSTTRHSDVFGQFIDAETGAKVGPEMFLISETAPNDDSTYFGAQATDVVYNYAENEFFVVWSSDDDAVGMVAGEQEIFGQRIHAATREQIGPDLRISDMGPNGNAVHDAVSPAIAHDHVGNTYCVVWSGSDTAHEWDIYGQRLSATGSPIGTNDFRVSTMGPNGSTTYWASGPDVQYNSIRDEFLVSWHGYDDSLGTNESEIWIQRISAVTGAALGVDDQRITNVSDAPFGQAYSSSIAYNGLVDEYLVAFQAHDPIDRIRGQRLRGIDGVQIGTNDFAISDAFFGVVQNLPEICFNPTLGQYLVTWRSEATGPMETTGQRLSGTGAEIGANDFVLSTVAPGHAAGYQAIAWADAEHEFLAVWDAGGIETMGENGEEIYAQRLTQLGGEIDDDQRITGMGEACFDAFDPAIAYNPLANEYLVVWEGDHGVDPLTDDEFEIFAQLIDAETGAEKGVDDARVSSTGADGNAAADAVDPAVAYCASSNLFLVVWSANPGTGGMAATEFEIFGRLVEAETGAPADGPDLRFSDMGSTPTATYAAQTPAIAASPDGFLVVWRGDDDTAPLVDNDFEIFIQHVNAFGQEVGVNDFRISDMGGPGDTAHRANLRPAVAYTPKGEEFLVVWSGDDGTPPLTDNENEIFGQRIDVHTGLEVGVNDFRISDMGPDGTSLYGATSPQLAYHLNADEFLVVWSGDDHENGLVEGELEIFGQRIRAGDGVAVGPNDFRISHSGPDGDPNYDAFSPAVASFPGTNQYLVVWDGESQLAPYVDGEAEVFGQLLDGATGVPFGASFAVSEMGPPSSTEYDAFWPAVAASSDHGFFAVWSGDHAAEDAFEDEFEIFGQLVEPVTSTSAGAVAAATTGGWLGPVTPNPSVGAMRFSIRLDADSPVRARLVNVQGRVVATLLDERVAAGTHDVVADVPANRLAAGVYFVEIEAGSRREARKVVLVK